MQKSIAKIKEEIAKYPANSAWSRGVRDYAEELFDEYIEGKEIHGDILEIDKLTNADLLNGADDWSQYSWGGCALIYDSDICERLCTKSEQKRKHDGELPPNRDEQWLDIQARALFKAAGIVIRIVNRKEFQK